MIGNPLSVLEDKPIQFLIIPFSCVLNAFNVPSGTFCCESNFEFITTLYLASVVK